MPQGISHPSWSSHHSRSPHLHAAKKPKTTKTKPPAVYQPNAHASTPSPRPHSAADYNTPEAAAAAAMSRDLLPIKSHIRSASFASPASARTASATGRKRPREDDSKDAAPRRTRSAGGDAQRSGTADPATGSKEAAFQRQLIAVFVPRALKESVEGNSANYNDLVAHFIPKPLEPGNIPLPPLLPLLRALTAHVSLLRPELHGALVTAILALPWATADDRFVKTYVGWAGVLVSAHPSWAKEVVAMAVKGFRWQPVFTDSSITRRIYHARHHFLLAHLLSLIPTLPTVLQQVLQKNAPHKRDTEVAQATWVRNCCELIEYCPELGARVWGGLVDKMLRIDVEITNRVEDDDDDDDEEEDEEDDEDDMIRPAPAAIDPFDLLVSQDVPKEGDETEDEDEDDDDDDDADPDIDALSTDGEQETDDEDILDEAKALLLRKQKREAVKALRCKLDAMLAHFLRHLIESMGTRERGLSAAELGAQLRNTVLGSGSSSAHSTPRGSRPATPTTATTAPTRPPPTAAQSLAHFQSLLNLFSRQILPTSATQHLPFVIFMCASFTPAHTELFLHLLVLQALYARTTDAPTLASQPVSLSQRVAATVYIGSLVCRARFVTDDQARTVTQYLLAYVEGKLSQARDQPLHTLDELPLFYAVCQAVMLIFCFRWRAFRSGAGVSDDCVAGELEMDDIIAEDEQTQSGEWMNDLDTLQRALTSDLNPLYGCNTTVVSTFAKVAHSTGFAYCFSIIEANQQAAARNASSAPQPKDAPAAPQPANGRRIPSGSGMSRAHTTHAMLVPRRARQTNIEAGLDGYFPFDPYDLPRSGEYVENLYRTWDEVAVDLGGDSDDDDSDDEEEEEDDDMEEIVSSDEGELAEGRMSVPKTTHRILRPSPGHGSFRNRRDILRDGVLSTSLETMSISPNISAQ